MPQRSTFSLGPHVIGTGRCFVIAEAGVNHNGDPDLAKRLVDEAAAAGADAVKFQSFKADKVATAQAPKAEYQLRETSAGQSQVDMLRALELSGQVHRELAARCAARGLMFLSTPFDADSVDLLQSLGVAAFKVPSGEITNLPLLQHIGRKGKPVLLSTGMSTLDEVRTAVATLRQSGCEDIAVLHCVSCYPAEPEDINLRAMATLREAFALPVGFSDHTTGIDIALAACAVGASVIEKHFTLDRNMTGPDHKASVEPREFAELVRSIRRIEGALGDGLKVPRPSEAATAAVARRSLVAAQDLLPGTRLTEAMIAIKRPGTGLPPAMLSQLVGREVRETLREGELLRLEMLR